MKAIDDARKNSSRDSVYGYVEAVELSVAALFMNNHDVDYDGQYTIHGNKLTNGDSELAVNYKGNQVTGNLTLEKGKVVSAELTSGGYNLIYLNGRAYLSGEKVDGLVKYVDGTAVYFNPETGKPCNEAEAVSTNFNKTGCMKWYTFGDDDNKLSVKLLLDHNTSNSAWISKEDYVAAGGTEEEYGSNGNNKYGPITVTNALKSDTSTWQAGLNPRLITANEIAHITGNDTANNWNSNASTNWFYLGTNNQTQDKTANNKYAWVFDRLNSCVSNGGCNIEDNSAAWGYWTSDAWAGNSLRAWCVDRYSNLTYYSPDPNNGIHPVVSISKSSLK